MKYYNLKLKQHALQFFSVFCMFLILSGCVQNGQKKTAKPISITNVSYDATREFYDAYNTMFQVHWMETTGQEIEIIQSHGGSGKQARSVLEGNEADVVTLALESDINELQKAELVLENWADEFAGNSAPYTSTIVFLVRKGNPKKIYDWNDLIKSGVEIITPNPKSSGGARWNFLAAWVFAENQFENDTEQCKQFVAALYRNVTVLDSGARGATTTFVENGQGDVLLAWENEALLSQRAHPDQFEIVTPSISILAEPPIAVVDAYAEKHGTTETATAYLSYLYSEQAQRLEAQYYYRPYNQTILYEFENMFDLNVQLVSVQEAFGDWKHVSDSFFADGAIFDQIYHAQA